MKKQNLSEPIHVLYSLSDIRGTYSKYVGTSMCSLLENTKSKIVFHVFHDGSISEENKKKFSLLVEHYKASIGYINIREVAIDICDKAKKIFSDAMQDNARYPEAAMYRIMAPQLLHEQKRLIYLDADTIVNMDIKKLWNENLNNSGIGVVGEYELLLHYGYTTKNPNDSESQEKILSRIKGANLGNVFNSGVLLMDLNKLREKGDMLIPGMKFLAKYPGEANFYDQDILNYFFAVSATRLAWNYNILLHWDKKYSDGEIKSGIYHYMGHALTLDPTSKYDILFYDYFIKTPWCNGKFLCSIYWVGENIIKDMISPVLKDLQSIARLLMHKKIVIAVTDDKLNETMIMLNDIECTSEVDDKSKIKNALTKDEISEICKKYNVSLLELGSEDDNINLSLPYDVDEYIYAFFVKDYKKIKSLLENAGLRERQHFMDGVALTLGEKWLRIRINQGLFFSVL